MKIVIIGAGIAGLGAAYYLSKSNHNVMVLEASGNVGGRSCTITRRGSGIAIDVGTQFFHSNYHHARHLLSETGLLDSLSVVHGYTRIYDERASSGYYNFNKNIPWYGPEGLFGNLKIGQFLLRHLHLLRRYPFSLTSPSMADCLPGMSDKLHPSVVNGIVRPLSLIGALAEPDAMNISLHHLMRLVRIILTTRFYKLQGGVDRLHRTLAKRLPVILDAPVSSLAQTRTAWEIRTRSSDRVFTADHVILATPAKDAASLMPSDFHEEKSFLESIKAPPFVLPTFFLDRPMCPGTWSYLFHQKQRGLISYLTDVSQLTAGLADKAIIQPWICYPNSTHLVDRTDSEITERCLDELDGYFPGFSSWVIDASITRHASAVPFHPVGHEQRAIEFLKKMAGKSLSVCGDYLSGGYLEASLWSAKYVSQQFD